MSQTQPTTSHCSMQKCRVLILTTAMGMGGAERNILRLLVGLDSAKYQVTIAGLALGTGRLLELIPTDRGNFVNLGARSKADTGSMLRLMRLLRRDEIDLVYAFMFHAGMVARVVGRLVRIPIIVCSERNVIDRAQPQRRLALRLTWRLADHFTAVSEAARDYLIQDIKVDPNRATTIYNGVDLDEFSFIERDWTYLDGPVVGCVGNLEPKKGYSDWIRAASIVSQSVPHARFRIVGEGSQRHYLAALIREHRLSDRIELAGYRTDIAAELAGMGVYVQSSLYEGMPNAVMEAMATGLPVVATNVGGTSELVLDGVTGFVVPPRRPELIAERVLYLLRNTDVAEKMGRAGRERAERVFPLQRMVRETDALFERLLWQKRRLRYSHGVGWVQFPAAPA